MQGRASGWRGGALPGDHPPPTVSRTNPCSKRACAGEDHRTSRFRAWRGDGKTDGQPLTAERASSPASPAVHGPPNNGPGGEGAGSLTAPTWFQSLGKRPWYTDGCTGRPAVSGRQRQRPWRGLRRVLRGAPPPSAKTNPPRVPGLADRRPGQADGPRTPVPERSSSPRGGVDVLGKRLGPAQSMAALTPPGLWPAPPPPAVAGADAPWFGPTSLNHPCPSAARLCTCPEEDGGQPRSVHWRAECGKPLCGGRVRR